MKKNKEKLTLYALVYGNRSVRFPSNDFNQMWVNKADAKEYLEQQKQIISEDEHIRYKIVKFEEVQTKKRTR